MTLTANIIVGVIFAFCIVSMYITRTYYRHAESVVGYIDKYSDILKELTDREAEVKENAEKALAKITRKEIEMAQKSFNAYMDKVEEFMDRFPEEVQQMIADEIEKEMTKKS